MSSTVTKVAEGVKETLLGSTVQEHELEQLTVQTSATFRLHARKDEESGELAMGVEEFINAIAPKDEDYMKIKREQYGILFRVADRRNKNSLNLYDFSNFLILLAKPDAEYEIAFRLFDVGKTGSVKLEDFKKLYELNKGADSIPFDWNCEWVSLYTGGKKHRHEMTYPQFAQMLRGLQGERIRQAFHLFDKDGDGYIEPEDFQRIILETAKHKLSNHLLENLHTLCNISTGSKISYANVRAFQNVIREMDLVEMIIRRTVDQSQDGKITRAEFLDIAAKSTRFSRITPMEADILFHFASLDQPTGRLSLSDFAKVLDPSWRSPLYNTFGSQPSDSASDVETSGESLLFQILESVHHFALGSFAGAFGALMVYPIDLVKTRMQNQRSTNAGKPKLYKNSIDCFRKVIKGEGFRGLYSGVLPQMIGVAPEKAIKLTVNDMVRGYFSDKNGKIWWPHELLAGGSAGACQVVFTNPLEIVKIRLQVQGEAYQAALAEQAEKKSKGEKVEPIKPKRSAMWTVRHLGLGGLYKGASACLSRDVPFSAIYFPAYNHIKRDYFGESQTHKLGVVQLLTAGAIAGMPAAYLTTPFDVIKTRLQVEVRKGDTAYTSLRHCASTVYKEEGFKAFFKGGPARILRSSPQFGFTLAAYEVLQNALPMPGGHSDPAMAHGTSTFGDGQGSSIPYMRSKNALKIILDIDENFGRPKTNLNEESWAMVPKILGGKK